MAKESSLSKAIRESVKIEKFIFHVVIKGEDEPRTMTRVDLEPKQRAFFCQRIADSSEGTQFKFREKDMGTALRCKRIVDDPENNFLPESINLATDFQEEHKGNVTDGAFIVAHFTIEVDGSTVPMIAMIKMDHSRVLEYKIQQEAGGSVAKISEILNSFVESKTAVQKCAIVDVGDTFDWDVLAFEKKKTIGIAEYFRVFLKVTESDNSSNLTRKAVSSTFTWARANSADLPEVPRHYKERAIQYLEMSDHFDTAAFVDAVVKDDDVERKARLMDGLLDELTVIGVAGQRFAPKPGSIPDRDKRNKLITKEKVQIIWFGDEESAGIKIGDPDNNGMIDIHIRTKSYTD
tara:strand:+ start:16215 stop:17261 length:1047 start_codon:yes stop_codon:yes gene_type:complete